MKKESIIIYKYNQLKNDIEYITELWNAAEVARYFNIKNARQYIIKEWNGDADDVKHLIQGNFIAIKNIIEYDDGDEFIKTLYN